MLYIFLCIHTSCRVSFYWYPILCLILSLLFGLLFLVLILLVVVEFFLTLRICCGLGSAKLGLLYGCFLGVGEFRLSRELVVCRRRVFFGLVAMLPFYSREYNILLFVD